MFNPNKIIKVMECSALDAFEKEYDSCFVLSPLIQYVVTDGMYLILQTEKDYITLGFDGVNVYDNLPFAESEYLIEDADFVVPDEDDIIFDDKTLLFVGERLIDVIEHTENEYFELLFDDFSMLLYPRRVGKPPFFWTPRNSVDVPIHGFERHITRKCDCGSMPELMLDFLYDFYLRCPKCHRATWDTFDLRYVIDDWNNGETPRVQERLITDGEIFFNHADEPVHYIILDDHPWFSNTNLCDSDYVLVAIGDEVFKIGSQYVDGYEDGFTYERVTGLSATNHRRIISTETEQLRFIRFEQEPDCSPVLRFQLGERPLLITADGNELMVGLSHWDVNDEWIDYDNIDLLNDGGEPIDA